MIQTIAINLRTDLKTEVPFEERLLSESNEFSYTVAYIGPYTYAVEIKVDNDINLWNKERGVTHNFHLGNGNGIGVNLKCVFGRNHNIKMVTSGALEAQMRYSGILMSEMGKSTFHTKGSIILQNDIWVGDNVTIMSGCIIRNGAVIAQNAHVVKDVPAYAIVGGNPAKVIGWRFPRHIIEKLQMIQWWYWSHDKILQNYDYFTEDVEGFCDKFYDEAKQQFEELSLRRNVKDDAYLVYVDYYENYSSYPAIIEEFLAAFTPDSNKRLILFIQNDVKDVDVDEAAVKELKALAECVKEVPNFRCSLEVVVGDKNKAVSCLLESSHFIMTRTYNTVYTTCLADQFGIEIISGVDINIAFTSSGHNMIRE